MAAAKQTSVRVPREAVAALEAYAAKHGKSRDAALRAALQNYVTTQSALEPEQRLTHVTTVLRYPPQPPGRGRPDPRAHLRFRIDTDLKTEATDLGYRLPGQSRRHGHHDYAARPLTDAVMTAIHEAEPFTVTGTEDLPQTLTQRIALALWRLAAAATITEAETQALWTSGDPDLAIILTEEEDVAWHHPWRNAAAHHILATLLADDEDANEWLGMLDSQTDQYQTLVSHLQQRHPDAAWLQDDLAHLDAHRNSVQGRGGTAVWRAQRALEMTRIEKWLTDPTSSTELELTNPDWKLTWPADWMRACFRWKEPVPADLMAHADASRVAVIEYNGASAYWPLTADGEPVEAFAGCLTAGRNLTPAQFAEVVLLDDHQIPAAIPAARAHELGFISEAERESLIATADAANAAMVAATLKRAEKRLDADELAELKAAAGNPRKFSIIAGRHHLQAWYRNDRWEWDINSIVDATRAGHDADRLEALTDAYLSITKFLLEMDMNSAWSRAFWLGYASPDNEV